MQLVDGNFKFAFNYAAYDQASNLHLAASIYDVTTGTASFVAQVTMSYTINGGYYGTYQGAPGHTYLVICVVYQDSGLTTIDPDRSPSAECYQAVSNGLFFFGSNYATYDQDPDLFLAANIYDVTAGTSFLSQVAMVEVAFGVYFAHFTPTVDHSYVIEKSVYTDGTYTTVDTDRSPGLDSFQSFDISGSGIVINNVLTAATLIGQCTEAILEAQC